MITQTTDLNLIPNGSPIVIHVDQYDTGTGRLIFNLYDDDVTYTPTGTAIIQGTKPDNHGFTYNATLVGNVVTADLTQQMTAVAGSVRCQIVVTESDGRTGSFAFILEVQKSALPDDTVLSDSDLQLIQQAIQDSAQAVIDAEDSAEDAEAWAVGERNGVPVTSGDETYENNAKYWASYSGTLGHLSDVTISAPQDAQVLTYDANSAQWINAAAGGVPSLSSLPDVNISAVSDGQALRYDSNSGKWINEAVPEDITDLGDVTISAPTDGQALVYDSVGQEWKNQTVTASTTLSNLTDVTITTPTNNQVLTYDSNSGVWENATFSGGSGGSTIKVTTSESDLYNQTVTITDGNTTYTETFSGSGEATFSGVTVTGSLTISSTGNGQTATTTLQVPYFGNYTTSLSFFSASIVATFPVGTCTCVIDGNTVTASGSPYTFTVKSAGTYTVTLTSNGQTATQTATITNDGDSVSVSFSSANIVIDYSGLYDRNKTYRVTGNNLTGVSGTFDTTQTTLTVPVIVTGTYVVRVMIGVIDVNKNVSVTSLSSNYNVSFASGSISLTYDADFISASATVTDGISTFYTGLNNVSLTEIIEIPRTGTWTISATVNGTTYSTTAEVTDLSTQVSATLSMTETITVTLYSAASDTVTYTDYNGSQTVTTDSSGSASNVSITYDPNSPTITFTSSVAKDPTNLANDYSKSVTVTDNTTEIYIMPDNVLYWYGYSNNIEDLTLANGWTFSGTPSSTPAPVYNTNSIRCEVATSKGIVGIAGLMNAQVGDKLCFIATNETQSNAGFDICDTTAKVVDISTTLYRSSTNTTSPTYWEYTYDQTSDYIVFMAEWVVGRASTLSAMWIE